MTYGNHNRQRSELVTDKHRMLVKSAAATTPSEALPWRSPRGMSLETWLLDVMTDPKWCRTALTDITADGEVLRSLAFHIAGQTAVPWVFDMPAALGAETTARDLFLAQQLTNVRDISLERTSKGLYPVLLFQDEGPYLDDFRRLIEAHRFEVIAASIPEITRRWREFPPLYIAERKILDRSSGLLVERDAVELCSTRSPSDSDVEPADAVSLAGAEQLDHADEARERLIRMVATRRAFKKAGGLARALPCPIPATLSRDPAFRHLVSLKACSAGYDTRVPYVDAVALITKGHFGPPVITLHRPETLTDPRLVRLVTPGGALWAFYRDQQ